MRRAGRGPESRPLRWLTIVATVAGLLGALSQVAPAEASVSFTRAWGWGVSYTGASPLETCSGSCQQGIQGGGAGALNYPAGVAVDSSGNVYIWDEYNSRIDEYSSSGGFIQAWGWGVSDGASQLETCTTACRSGLSGAGAGELNALLTTSTGLGLAVDASGDVYVADMDNNRIDEFSPGGGFDEAWGYGVVDGANHLETCTTSTGCEEGLSGSGAGQMYWPTAVALSSSGNLYVADYGNNRIDEFSSTGTYLGDFGQGQLDDPYGLTVDSSGDIFVADAGNDRIAEYSSSGTLTATFGSNGSGAGQLYDPHAVAVDAGSGDVYVADSGNNRIAQFASDGSFIRAWGWGVVDGANQFETCTTATGCQAGASGSGSGEFLFPSGIAVDASGRVDITDANNERVQQFSSSGSFTQTWGWGVGRAATLQTCTTSCDQGLTGGGAGQFFNPMSVALDAGSGDLYVADNGNNRIDEFNGSGSFVKTWGWGVSDGLNQFESCSASCQSGASGGGAGELDQPYGVAVDGSSRDVYVADSANDRIDQFSASGSFIRTWGWGVSDGANQFETCASSCQSGISGGSSGELNEPEGIAVGGSGDVYVGDTNNRRMDVFSASGLFIEAWGWGVSDGASQLEVCTTSCRSGAFGFGTPLAQPEGIAVDPSGNVYADDTINNRVEEFSSSGGFIQDWGSGQVGGPEGVAVDGSGDVYVGDTKANRIDEFSPGDYLVAAWGWGVADGANQFETCTSSCRAGLAGGGAGQLDQPAGVAVDGAGDIYVADQANQRLDELLTSRSGATTSVATSDNSIQYGEEVTFTASVSAAPPASGTPTGSVDFTAVPEGSAGPSVSLCTGVTLSSGTAVCHTSSLPAGTWDVVASYNGDFNFSPSSAGQETSVTQTVTANSNVSATDTGTSDGTGASAIVEGASPGTTGSYSTAATDGTAGTDWVKVNAFKNNPTPSGLLDGIGYFGVQVSSSSTFSALNIVDCNVGNMTILPYWYDSNTSSWAPISASEVTAGDPNNTCDTISLTNSTVPSISDLEGSTPEGASRTAGDGISPDTMRFGGAAFATQGTATAAYVRGFRHSRHGPDITFTWRAVIIHGVAGYGIFAGQREINHRLIRVHASRRYRLTVRYRGRGPFSIKVRTTTGHWV